MVLGSVLVASALGLFLYNEHVQRQAEGAVAAVMPQLVEVIVDRQAEATEPPDATEVPAILPSQETREMTVVEIDGYGYIGFVGIPSLGIELPVMADWSYPQLKISPCRFTGDINTDDLVIMAHNYVRHFGPIKRLHVGDEVTFTDMDGVTTRFEVVATDILEPTAVEEMTAGEYDLTLFTCTYGGKSRVTVRCDRVE